MTIEESLKQTVVNAVKALYDKDLNDNLVQIQKTKKEFEGDLTVVVFPILKLSGKKPEDTAQDLGNFI